MYKHAHKILTYQDAITKIRKNREQGKRVILSLGVFDIVHLGHLAALEAARRAGDLLFVGLDNDTAVRLNKGESRPFNPLRERLRFLAELHSVDYVFGFLDSPKYKKDHQTFVRRLRELQPSAITCTTYEGHIIEAKRQQAVDAGVELIVLDHPEQVSSSRILQYIGYE